MSEKDSKKSLIQEHHERLRNLSLEFDRQYPSEGDCVDAAFNLISRSKSIVCRQCKLKLSDRIKGSRYLDCSGCKCRTWFTTGTIFERSRKLRAWLKAIWLMERRPRLNSASLATHLGVALSTAWKILQTINSVIADMLDRDFSLLPAEIFSSAICKRSRATPADKHPNEEGNEPEQGATRTGRRQEQTEDAHKASPPFSKNTENTENIENAVNTDNTDLINEPLDGDSILVLRLLASGKKNTEQLLQESGIGYPSISAPLVTLEIKGLIEREFGDIYKLTFKGRMLVHSQKSPSKEEVTSVLKAITILKWSFHGVSRKYLQNYLSFLWHQYDYAHWSEGSLLEACINATAVPIRKLLISVASNIVKFVAPFQQNLPPAHVA